MIRRLARIGALVTVAAASIVPGSAYAAPARPVTPIRHLVVMTQDQHSFDNYFGTRPGVDGLPAGTCLPRRKGAPGPCARPFALQASNPHEQLRSTPAIQLAAMNGGRMDGFVYAQRTGAAAVGYYRQQDVPVLGQLADHGVLFDRWFTSVPGDSIQNRLFAVSAQSTPDQAEVPAAGWRNIPLIFDRLQAAGVSWRIYVQNYEPALTIATAGAKARRGGQVARVPVLATTRFAESPTLSQHVADLDRYYADLAAGTLPAVSFVVSTSTTERPPGDPTSGQVLARTVLNSLSQSTSWSSSAFLLDYDTSGGWYDHVAPPTQDGAQLGPRVPALLVSPYATPGTANHTVFDSAAILKFIEHNWSLAPLTTRDRDAADLSTAFSFQQRPRAASLAETGDGRPALVRPSSPIIYASYLLVLLAVAVATVWLAVREWRRRPHPVPPA